jgi:hypothetical protein
MELNDHLAKIVEGLVADITSNVVGQIDGVISNAINHRLNTYDYATHIQQAAADVFEKQVSKYTVDPKKLETRIVEKINATIEQVQGNTGTLINEAIALQIATTDFQRAITDSVGTIVADRLNEFVFPANSINASALQTANLVLSGDNIVGGLIQNFSSTGIDDRATNVALTILDDATVVENNLLTKDLTVEGAMTINGDFIINGNVPTESPFYQGLISGATTNALQNLDHTLFNNYSTLIFDRLKNEGLDLSKITINGTEVVKGDALGSSIVNSNLQKLGMLKELQVAGESLLAETLYVTPKRVGINTIEPSAALSVWDEEVEILFTKKQQNTGSMGTPRQQRMILTANNKDNIILETDGSVRIDDLRIGSMRFTVGDKPPNYVSERGHVVWNTNPNLGGPLGWVCMGGANWANFGIID